MSRLHQLPNVLILHLKRFEFDAGANRYKKLTNPVTFPATLDLAPYCTTDPVSVVSAHRQEKGDGRGENGVIVTPDLNVDCSVLDVRSEISHIQQHRPPTASPPSSPEGSRSHSSSRLSPSSSSTSPTSSPDTPSGEEDHHRRPTYNRPRGEATQDVNDVVATVTDDSLPSITNPTTHTNTHTNTYNSSQRRSMGTCYKLTSVVHHLGSQPFIGHYTCDTVVPARTTTSTTSAVADTTTTNGNSNGSASSSKGHTWQHCNDTMISSITEVRRPHSYVIYYASSLM